MSTPLCSVVIVTWNRRKELEPALDSIFRQTIAGQVEVIVIDNQSTDNTVDWLTHEYPHPVRLYKFSTNMGASAGRNAGIRLAQAPYICFLDSDAELESLDAIEKSIKYLEHERSIRAVSSLIWLDREHKGVFSKGCYTTSEGHFHGERTFTETADSHFISTCFSVWEKSLLEELRGFDPWYFWGIEDLDISLRAYHRALRGEKTAATRYAILEDVHVIHEMSPKGRHYQPNDFHKAFHAIERQRLYLVLSYGGLKEFFRVMATTPLRMGMVEGCSWGQRLSWKKRLAMTVAYPALRLLKLIPNLLHQRRNFLADATLPEVIKDQDSTQLD